MQLKAFLLLWFGAFLYWMGINGIMAVLPLHMQAIHYSGSLIGWIMGASSLAALGSRFFLGTAVDRYGFRPILATAGLLLGLAGLAGQRAFGVPGLVLGNAMLGASVSFLLTGGLAAAAAAAPAARRGTALAWYGLANSLAAMIAAPFSIPLFSNRGFAVVQMAVIFLGLAVCLLGALTRVRTDEGAQRKPSRGAIILPRAIRPALVGAAVAVASGGFALVGPLKAQGLGLANPGLYLSAQAGAMFVARMALGPVSDRLGRGWVIVPGMVSLVLGFGLIGVVTHPLLALGAPALVGIGLGATGAGLVPWTVDLAGGAQRGLAINTFYLFWELALFVGQTVVGNLLSIGEGWAYTGVALVATAGLLYYLVSSRRQASAESHSEVV